MLTVNKITKIFVMADEFCKVFNAMLRRRGLSETRKDRKLNYHMTRVRDKERHETIESAA